MTATAAAKTFRNTHFTARDHECTNLVFAQGETNPDPENWEECDEAEIDAAGADRLHTEYADGQRHTYYGWL